MRFASLEDYIRITEKEKLEEEKVDDNASMKSDITIESIIHVP
jgi:hypothetical protein